MLDAFLALADFIALIVPFDALFDADFFVVPIAVPRFLLFDLVAVVIFLDLQVALAFFVCARHLWRKRRSAKPNSNANCTQISCHSCLPELSAVGMRYDAINMERIDGSIVFKVLDQLIQPSLFEYVTRAACDCASPDAILHYVSTIS